MSIGSLFGALLGAYTSDWWGRRKNLTFGVIIFVLGNIIQITAMESWIHMMMGRFLAGIGVGILSVGEFGNGIDAAMDSNNLFQVYLCSSLNVAQERLEALWWPRISS
jgi:MFS family permease